MTFALFHATLGWAMAFLACLLLRRHAASVRCWAWRLGLLKGPIALLLAVPVVFTAPVSLGRDQSAAPSSPPWVAPTAKARPAKDAFPAVVRPVAIRPSAMERSRPAPEPWNPLPWVYGLGVAALILARAASAKRVRPGMPRVEGVLRPRVVVPPGLAPEDAAMALAHETAHVRRRDPQWSFVADLVCTGLWFAPPVWLCARAMRAEAEVSCDADAVAATRARRREYARLLLAFAGPAPANALGGPARRLARRILMLEKSPKPLPRPAALGLLAIGFVALLPWRAEARPQASPLPPSTLEGRILPIRVTMEGAMESLLASPDVRKQIGWTSAQNAALWSRYRRWNAVWSDYTARSAAYKRTHTLNESVRFDTFNAPPARRRAEAAAGPMPWSQTQRSRLKTLALAKYGLALWADEEIERRLALTPSQRYAILREEHALLEATSNLVPDPSPLPKAVNDLVVWTTAKYFAAAPKDRPALSGRIQALVARHRAAPVVSRERERAIMTGPEAWKLRAEANRRLEALLTPAQRATLDELRSRPETWTARTPANLSTQESRVAQTRRMAEIVQSRLKASQSDLRVRSADVRLKSKVESYRQALTYLERSVASQRAEALGLQRRHVKAPDRAKGVEAEVLRARLRALEDKREALRAQAEAARKAAEKNEPGKLDPGDPLALIGLFRQAQAAGFRPDPHHPGQAVATFKDKDGLEWRICRTDDPKGLPSYNFKGGAYSYKVETIYRSNPRPKKP